MLISCCQGDSLGYFDWTGWRQYTGSCNAWHQRDRDMGASLTQRSSTCSWENSSRGQFYLFSSVIMKGAVYWCKTRWFCLNTRVVYCTLIHLYPPLVPLSGPIWMSKHNTILFGMDVLLHFFLMQDLFFYLLYLVGMSVIISIIEYQILASN